MPPSPPSHDVVTPGTGVALAHDARDEPTPERSRGERSRRPRGRHAPARSGWLRRVAVLPIGVVGVAVGCLIPWRDALHSGVFDDTFWHRAAGVWMLDHHRVMSTDVFSYTVLGHPWITPEWGYDVAPGPVGAPSARWRSGCCRPGWPRSRSWPWPLRCRLVGAGWTWTGLLCVETGAAITLLLDDRPQMVSYFFLALCSSCCWRWPGVAGRG